MSFDDTIKGLFGLYPVTGFLYVGASASGLSQIADYLSTDKVVILCADTVTAAAQNDNHFVYDNKVFADQTGTLPYYHATHQRESGLLEPELLQPYLRNLKTKNTEDRKVSTLDDFLSEMPDGQPAGASINWLFLDSFPSGLILKGAQNLLQSLDGLIVKVLFDEDASDAIAVNTKSAITEHLSPLGYVPCLDFKSVAQSFGHTLYVRDWKKANAAELDRRKTQAESAARSVETLQENINATNALVESLKSNIASLKTERSGDAATIETLTKTIAEHEDRLARQVQREEERQTLVPKLDALYESTASNKEALTGLVASQKDTLGEMFANLAERLEAHAEERTNQADDVKASLVSLESRHDNTLESLSSKIQSQSERTITELLESFSNKFEEKAKQNDQASQDALGSIETSIAQCTESLASLRADLGQQKNIDAAASFEAINKTLEYLLSSLKDVQISIGDNTGFQKIASELQSGMDKLLAQRPSEPNDTQAREIELTRKLTAADQAVRVSAKLLTRREDEILDLREKYSALAKKIKPKTAKAKQALADEWADEPVRIIHHLSCTGGTLFAKCIAANPNVLLLNEVDPLSDMRTDITKPLFSPTDMIALLRQGDPDIDRSLLSKLFLENLATVRDDQMQQGRHIVIRDHSHGQFLIKDQIQDRPTLQELIAREFAVKSVVTVRNPIDSYRSMLENGWHKHFSPSTFDEYCRRYLKFLTRHKDSKIIKYEDLIAEPEKTLQSLCTLLDLTYSDTFKDTFDTVHLSGDSGRSGGEISDRPRRDLSEDLVQEIETSENYIKLTKQLEYKSD